jgi:hypothetical protein
MRKNSKYEIQKRGEMDIIINEVPLSTSVLDPAARESG